ncbi:unnamed protein product, partial [Staurois parvus]
SVPLYIRCAHQSAPLHQLPPSECPFTSVAPIRVPLYIRYPHHISPSEYPFISYSPSECPFPSHVPIRVPLSTVCAHLCPLNIKWAHQSAP